MKKKPLIGWQEWCTLPALNLPIIKAKIDTGAKTSALHAFDIERFEKDGKPWVKFKIFPLQKNKSLIREVQAPVLGQKLITNSGGGRENRLIIKTPIVLGSQEWEILVSLTNREPLLFRLLLGRDAISGRFLINCGKRRIVTRPMTRRDAKSLYL